VSDPAGDYIAWFEETGLHDRPRVGGKGAGLAELQRAELSIPPGFVLTTAAFRHFRAAFKGEADPVALRARLEAEPLPDAIGGPLLQAYRRLGDGADDAAVAVRSSATAEDSAEASFAGLQDTFLWVRGEANVLDAVRRCWASLYSDPAVSYRARLKLDDDAMAMAVVVQRMVDARSAGVMFTRSPLTGDRSVVAICAAWGLGSAVVGGEVTPDEFVVNKITGDVQRSIVSTKALRHVPDHAGSGTRAEPVPEPMQERAALEPDEIRALAALARRVEQHFGQPQDIEWAIDFEDRIFLLQSRPETVWSAREARAAEEGRAGSPAEKPFDHVLSFFGKRPAP
jgi:pyruvate,water dikinase